MSERISVTITAQDGASKTFTAIGNSAQKMGDQIESAGKEGTAGLKTIDTQAKSTGQSMDDIKAKATALGAAFGTLLSAAALLGANYRDQQRQVDGINRTYGDQADAILEVSEQIQDLTKFSNDAARESALLGTALVDAYGLSADQVGVLIERSADLAQIYGLELPDAFSRLSGAIRGEGEAAERLGLNLSDAAVAAAALDAGITDWGTPGAISEAEKAAFRYQLVLEQTAQSVGAAADAADSAGGRFRNFINNVDDAAESIGGFLGPVGEVAAEMAPIAIAAPVVAAGMANLGTAFIGTATGARVLSLALSPLAGGLVAVGAVLGAGYLAYKVYTDALNSTATAYDNLAESQHAYRMAGQDEIADTFKVAEETIRSFEETLRDLSGQYTTSSGFINMILPTDDQWNAAVNSMNAALNNAQVDQEAYLLWVQQQIAFATAIVSDPALFAANPTIIADTIERINNVDLTHFRVEAESAKAAADALNLALQGMGIGASAAGAGLADAASSADEMGSAMAQAAIAVGAVAVDGAAGLVAITDATQDFLGNGDNILDFWLQYQENLKATQAEYARLKAEAFEAGTPIPEAMQDTVSATEAAFEATVRLADALSDAGNNLDSVLRTYQQIDDLGQRSAAAGSIADNLIGAPGELGTVQDLWDRITAGTADAALTADQYNDALNAGVAIQQSNLRVQDDLTAMRAAQLPLLAEEQAAYEAQIEAISQLPPLEQRRALAMQDSAVQAQIAAQYATAYSASLGEIPPEVATNMIVSAAEADPVLKDLLLQFGLIEEGADGTITVNFPDGPTVQQTIIELTASIDALIVALGGIPPVHLSVTDDATPVIDSVIDRLAFWDQSSGDGEATLTDNASSRIAAIASRLAGLDASSASPYATVSDNATGTLQNIQALLNSIDGRTATTYVKTVYQTYGSGAAPPQGIPGFTRQHGGILGFAGGGVMFRGAEAGPELLHYASGGSTPIYHDGLYTAPANTYVSPANANPGLSGGMTVAPVFNNYAPIYGVDDLNNRFRDFAVTLVDDLNRHRTAAGV